MEHSASAGTTKTSIRAVLSMKVLLALFTFPLIAHAGFMNGTTLKKLADADERASGPAGVLPSAAFDVGRFSGYVIGVHDAVAGTKVCLTDGVTFGQLQAIVSKYLRDNPEKWNFSASSLVVAALSSASPCRR